jgi:DNA transformation protein
VSLSEGYVEHLKELLDGIGHITVRRMFGGAGVYCDGFIFAFLDEDVLYLKTDEPGRAPFEAEGMGPFTYESKDGPVQTFSYYRAPERLLDDPDDLREWVHRALAISQRDAAAKAKRKGGKDERKSRTAGSVSRSVPQAGGRKQPVTRKKL